MTQRNGDTHDSTSDHIEDDLFVLVKVTVVSAFFPNKEAQGVLNVR